jgi:hypothetical protein
VEILLQAIAPATGSQALLTAVRNAGLLRSDQHVAVDVDPVALL